MSSHWKHLHEFLLSTLLNYDHVWCHFEGESSLFFSFSRGLWVFLLSVCMHWPVIYVPVGKIHHWWFQMECVSQQKYYSSNRKCIYVMLADKEQICINRSGHQPVSPYFFIFFFCCRDNETFSLVGSKLRPFFLNCCSTLTHVVPL